MKEISFISPDMEKKERRFLKHGKVASGKSHAGLVFVFTLFF